MSDFASNLVYLRQRSGLSQQDVANYLKCSRSRIGMFETGNREPNIETLEALADLFNVDIDFLTGRIASNEWSYHFRQRLNEIISIQNSEDLIAAGLNIEELELIIAGTIPLSFDDACNIVDILGVSFDYMLGIKEKETPRNAFDFVEENQEGALSEQFSLNETEKSLVNDFRKLNSSGQKYILQTMAMTVQTYSEKNNTVSDVELA